ncbi:GNAT family N-acetyltransferase [Nocardioides sp.]|uniref:GNAT family N-acetyltransferase n=1 Tax=Nocardioides sp. TaxID=35761 RepID=UPI00286C6D69|nr:GNAT family N-acetyltransferase [Nocardioides sp.]
MSIVVRERRDTDLARLVELLAEQQAVSSYPVRWPLPFPAEQFLVRRHDRRAWVAELDGAVVGHVSVGDPEELVPRFTEATGAAAFGMVSALFTGLAARGRGVGSLLLDTAVAWVRARGEVPVLDVVPVHEPAVRLYRDRGWVEVGSDRFAWMSEDVPDVLLMALPPYPSTDSSASTGPSARS